MKRAVGKRRHRSRGQAIVVLPPNEGDEAVYCIHCGSYMREGSQFCEKCGRRAGVPGAHPAPGVSSPPGIPSAGRSRRWVMLTLAAVLLLLLAGLGIMALVWQGGGIAGVLQMFSAEPSSSLNAELSIAKTVRALGLHETQAGPLSLTPEPTGLPAQTAAVETPAVEIRQEGEYAGYQVVYLQRPNQWAEPGKPTLQ